MAEIIRIGESVVIHIPESLITQAHLSEGPIDCELTDQGILIHSNLRSHPRAGWKEVFQKLASQESNDLDECSNDFDEKEWEWPNL